jgi:mannose-6-phosphate isomerase-like protein (cupin superfamily)
MLPKVTITSMQHEFAFRTGQSGGEWFHHLTAIMKTEPKFLRRDPAEIAPWTETCGQIRFLVEAKDGAAGEVCEVEITDAKLHYHEHTDEFYYVLEGEGRMRLDEVEIELHKGVVVYVPRGVKHKAWGKLKALIVCIPRGVLQDVHELE